jgi:hypothetical protein
VFGAPRGEQFFVADAHRDDGKRFVVRSDEKLTTFGELQVVVSIRAELSEGQGRRETPSHLGLSVTLKIRAIDYGQSAAGWRKPGNGLRSPIKV